MQKPRYERSKNRGPSSPAPQLICHSDRAEKQPAAGSGKPSRKIRAASEEAGGTAAQRQLQSARQRFHPPVFSQSSSADSASASPMRQAAQIFAPQSTTLPSGRRGMAARPRSSRASPPAVFTGMSSLETGSAFGVGSGGFSFGSRLQALRGDCAEFRHPTFIHEGGGGVKSGLMSQLIRQLETSMRGGSRGCNTTAHQLSSRQVTETAVRVLGRQPAGTSALLL